MKFKPTLFNSEGIKCTYVGGSLDGQKEYVLDSSVVRLIKEIDTEEPGIMIPIHYEHYLWTEQRKDANEDGSHNFYFQKKYKSLEEYFIKIKEKENEM